MLPSKKSGSSVLSVLFTVSNTEDLRCDEALSTGLEIHEEHINFVLVASYTGHKALEPAAMLVYIKPVGYDQIKNSLRVCI